MKSEKRQNNKGYITLEACVSVLVFLILMLFMSGLFIIFMAQNTITHTLLQTTESLSFDPYATDKLKVNGKIPSIMETVAALFTSSNGNAITNPYYVADDKWYVGDGKAISGAAKKRFVGYLTGGDEEAADRFLKNLNVVDGLEGLDFSKSEVEGKDLNLVLSYQLEYEFNIFDMGKLDISQKACAALWRGE